MLEDLTEAADLTQRAIAALDRAGAEHPAAMLDHALILIQALIDAKRQPSGSLA